MRPPRSSSPERASSTRRAARMRSATSRSPTGGSWRQRRYLQAQRASTAAGSSSRRASSIFTRISASRGAKERRRSGAAHARPHTAASPRSARCRTPSRRWTTRRSSRGSATWRRAARRRCASWAPCRSGVAGSAWRTSTPSPLRARWRSRTMARPCRTPSRARHSSGAQRSTCRSSSMPRMRAWRRGR